jgi:hypothetical protein
MEHIKKILKTRNSNEKKLELIKDYIYEDRNNNY